jgi:hypothetical protein
MLAAAAAEQAAISTLRVHEFMRACVRTFYALFHPPAQTCAVSTNGTGSGECPDSWHTSSRRSSCGSPVTSNRVCFVLTCFVPKMPGGTRQTAVAVEADHGGRMSGGAGVYKGGQTVFRAGDEERSMFFVNRGSVLVVVDRKVVDRFEPGHLFGEVGMILGEKRTVFVSMSVEMHASEVVKFVEPLADSCRNSSGGYLGKQRRRGIAETGHE